MSQSTAPPTPLLHRIRTGCSKSIAETVTRIEALNEKLLAAYYALFGEEMEPLPWEDKNARKS